MSRRTTSLCTFLAQRATETRHVNGPFKFHRASARCASLRAESPDFVLVPASADISVGACRTKRTSVSLFFGRLRYLKRGGIDGGSRSKRRRRRIEPRGVISGFDGWTRATRRTATAAQSNQQRVLVCYNQSGKSLAQTVPSLNARTRLRLTRVKRSVLYKTRRCLSHLSH